MTGPSDVERHTADARRSPVAARIRRVLSDPAFRVGDEVRREELVDALLGTLAAAGVLVAARPTVPEPDDREALADAWDEGYDARREFCRQGHRSDPSCNPYHRAPAEPVQDQRPAPEATTVTEWGVRPERETVWLRQSRYYRDGVVTAVNEHHAAGILREQQGGTVVSRQRTTYADHVTDWEEVR